MTPKLLQDYLANNSTEETIINSMFSSPQKIEITEKKANAFFHKGLEVTINEHNKKISCQCTCNAPFTCLHVVAALRKTIDQLINAERKKKGLNELPDPTNNDTSIQLVNELLTNDLIDTNFPRNNMFFPPRIKIVSISLPLIQTTISNWDTTNQNIRYNKEQNTVSISCSCSSKKKSCEHKEAALRELISVFGEDLFTDNYINQRVEKEAKRYGITDLDNIQKIFNASLTPTGLHIVSKYKNIQATVSNIIPIIDEPTSIEIAGKAYVPKQADEYGLCVCFEYIKSRCFEFKPMEAKLNKAKTELSSCFKAFDNFSNNKELLKYETPEQQTLIIKTKLLNALLGEAAIDLNTLKRAENYFRALTPTLRDFGLFVHEHSLSLTRKNMTPIIISDSPVKLFFTLTESELFYTLKAKLSIGTKNYNVNASKLIFHPLFVIVEDELFPVDSQTAYYISHYGKNQETNYLKDAFEEVYEKVILPLTEKFEVQSTLFKRDKTTIDEDLLEKQVYINDHEGEYVAFRPAVQYPNRLVSATSTEMLLERDQNNQLVIRERNESFEDNFLEEFKSLHPAFENQEGYFFLTPDQLIADYWMLHATQKMQQAGMKVFGANNLKSFKFNLNKPIISVSVKSDIDWFDLQIEITYGDQKVNLKELQKAFLKKTNYVALGDGTLGILPEEWMKKFENYFKVGELKKGGIQLSNYQFGIIDELYNELETTPPFLMELMDRKKRLQNIEAIEEITIPKEIKAKLRDYQHHGVNWMVFLDKYQLGGCLADDMGLGKTLQAITFLKYLKNRDKKCLPSLIIAPTSLIFNWRNEVAKFCPSLKLLSFVGPNRMDLKEDFGKYDLILSTYGSLLNDVEFLKEMKFNYILLDESQAIKNPNSKRYKAVRLLQSYNRLVLTGTPIENNTFDLYAQMNFINPGLLGNMTHYKKEFSDAIDKEKDYAASALLGQMIAPFLLRRTKEQVATELPEKTESIIYCEMEKDQRKVYESFKAKYRDYLLNKIDENGVENAQMYILEGLTKLRQICNSTALIPDQEDYGHHSIKLDLLIENIKEKTGNHKILVFSQFVKMLQLIKNRLEEEHICYEYLDGQTTNREEKVANFQENKKVRVFLISLKAGGTGLNLTEADYVFLVDPWWNPAVENQAIDRCHRIGQAKKVMAYRMICKDTIEEKIALLQSTKKSMAASIISVDEERKLFDVEQVKAFFS